MFFFLTGCSGFIGSHLLRRLIRDGHKVIGVDNFISGSFDNIKDIKSPNFTFIEHDISKPIYFGDKIDWVLHFASPASPRDYLEFPIKTLKVGTIGTYNCLGIAKLKKARFFLASTSEVYGDPVLHPQPEEYWGNVNPVGPRSCYDESKRAAEALTFAYHRQHNVDIRVIRIFNTYGPYMRVNDGRVISNFISQALQGKDITVFGDGFQTRSFCYVDDLIEGIMRYIERADFTGPLNLGNPQEFTVLESARIIKKLTGSSSEIKFLPLPQDDPKRRKPDISKARKLISWQPKVSLEEGLNKTIPYFKEKIIPR